MRKLTKKAESIFLRKPVVLKTFKLQTEHAELSTLQKMGKKATKKLTTAKLNVFENCGAVFFF